MPQELRLENLRLVFTPPRSAFDMEIKISMQGNNGRKEKSKMAFKMAKTTGTIASLNWGVEGQELPENIRNFRIDDSTSIKLWLRKSGPIKGFRKTRESEVIKWSRISKSANQLVYEAEDSGLGAKFQLKFQLPYNELYLHSIAEDIASAKLSQEDREDIISKLKPVNDTLNVILEVAKEVTIFNRPARAIVGVLDIIQKSVLDRQFRYDKLVRALLQEMAHIQPFVKITHPHQSKDIGLLQSTTVEMLNLIHDACAVVMHRSERAKGLPVLKFLVAGTDEELLQEFKDKLQDVIERFDRSLATEIHKVVVTAAEKDEAKEIIEWLSPLDFVTRYENIIRNHVEGTGSWFLEREDIRDWMDGRSESRHIWCHGIPGGGKTMILSLLFSSLRQKYAMKSDTAVLCVYCDHKETETQSVYNLISSLVRQQVATDHPVPIWIRNYYKEHYTMMKPRTLKDLTKQIANNLKVSYERVYVLVDAMDECRPNIQSTLSQFLPSLTHNVRVLVTSRNKPEDDSSIWSALPFRANSDDVQKYVEQRLSESDYVSKLLSGRDDFRDTLVETVMDHCQDVMLLAKLHMDSLNSQITIGGLKHVLQNLPRGLQATFDDTLHRITNGQPPTQSSLAQSVLMWIIGAVRPLSIWELPVAAALKDADPCFDEEEEASIATIIKVCAGLVVVDEGRCIVRLAHKTVHEYLDLDEVKSTYFQDIELRIASLCLKYFVSHGNLSDIDNTSTRLLDSGNNSNSMPATESRSRTETSKVFLRYCSTYWPHHALKCQKHVLSLVLEVLQSDVLIKLSFPSNYYGRRDWAPWHNPPAGTAMHLLAFLGLHEIVKVLLEAAEWGHLEGVKLLIERDNCNFNGGDYFGRSPLSWAAKNGHLETVNALLVNGVCGNSKDNQGRTPLSHAAESGEVEVVNALLAKDGVDAESKDNSGQTPLSHAASQGTVEVVNALLAKDGVDAESKDCEGRTPLSHAAESGEIEVVEALLAIEGVDAHSRDNYGRTPLSYAAKNREVQVLQALLAIEGADAESKDHEGRTPLSHAAQSRKVNVVEALLAIGGVDADSRDNYGRTPLSYAAESSKVNVVEALLAIGGVDADSRDNCGRTPLSYAAIYGNVEGVKALLARDGVDADSRDKAEMSPLSYAAGSGHVEVVEALLARDGVDVDGKDYFGRVPLSHAARSGNIEVVKALLARGVDADSRDKAGASPLSYAAGRGEVEIVKALLARDGVDVDGKDYVGRVPLSHAARSGNTEVVKALLARDGVDADSRDKAGISPLSYAAERGEVEIVKALLANDGVDADSKDNKGRTPLSHAAAGWRALDEMSALFSNYGVDADNKDNKGRTPLSHAATGWRGHDAMSALMERDDVELDSRDIKGRTPLFYAARYGRTEAVKLLTARGGIELILKDFNSRTPLSLAAEWGAVEFVRRQLKMEGVQVRGPNNSGTGPMFYAELKGHENVVALLEADGQKPELCDALVSLFGTE